MDEVPQADGEKRKQHYKYFVATNGKCTGGYAKDKLTLSQNYLPAFHALGCEGDPEGCSACLEYLVGEVNDFCVDFLIRFVTLLLIL